LWLHTEKERLRAGRPFGKDLPDWLNAKAEALAYLRRCSGGRYGREKQIPFGNDSKKNKDNSKGKDKDKSKSRGG